MVAMIEGKNFTLIFFGISQTCMFFLPTALEIHFLPPVQVGNETIEELKEKVHFIMTEFYKKKEHLV